MSEFGLIYEPHRVTPAFNVWEWLASHPDYPTSLEAAEYNYPANKLRILLDTHPLLFRLQYSRGIIPTCFEGTPFAFRFQYDRGQQRVSMLLLFDNRPYPEGESAGAVCAIREEGNFTSLSPTLWNDTHAAPPERYVEGVEAALWPYLEGLADSLAWLHRKPVVCRYANAQGQRWFDMLVMGAGYQQVVGDPTSGFAKTFPPQSF